MTKKMAYCGVLTACALIFSYVEYLIPINIGVPGVKLGLANIVVIIALYKLGIKYALMINVVRIVIAALLFSGLFGMLFGLTGGLLSLAVMALLKKTNLFSVTGVSTAGGLAHNIGQMSAAFVLISNVAVFYYLPVLLISGGLTGFCVGFAANTIIKTHIDK